MIAVAGPPPLLNTNGARSRPNSEVDQATDRGEAPKDVFFCFCSLCHPIGLDFSPLLITRGVWVPDLVSGLHATLLPNNLQPCLH